MIKRNRNSIILLLILLTSAFIRFYNLMFDYPYFFNPDERNMTNAVSQFRLPSKLREIPSCIFSQSYAKPALPAGRRSRLNANCNLNPHFFAYGQFPLYLAFASDQITKPILKSLPFTTHRLTTETQPSPTGQALTTTFPSAIFWLRFYSALSSTFTVLMVFLISKQFLTFNFALLTSALCAFTPGLIQSAHFGTTESLLTYFFVTSAYLSIRYLSNLSHFKFIFLSSLTIGLGLGSKLTGIFFFIPPFIALVIQTLKSFKKNKSKLMLGYWSASWRNWVIGLLVLIGSILIFILSSPYNIIELNNFKSAVFGYEADVALGKSGVFYTRQFIATRPILFQAEKIFPYALGWPVFILGTLGFLLLSLQSLVSLSQYILLKIKNLKLKSKNYNFKFKIFQFHFDFFILIFSFLLYFLPNAFLFVKWTRFMTPILPFFAIYSGYTFHVMLNLFQHPKLHLKRIHGNLKLGYLPRRQAGWVIGLLVFISLLPGIAFMSIYSHEDTRVQASRWIYDNISENSYILFDTANVIDIPLGLPDKNEVNKNYKLVSFDFYHLDENKQLLPQLLTHLEKADYIFVPSRRVFKNHMKFPQKYPLVTKYYQSLFSGSLGFERVAIFTSYPSLQIPLTANPYTLITFPDEDAEESWSVFDHPVVRIYRKVQAKSQLEYEILLRG